MTYVELLHTESEFIASERTDQQTLLIPASASRWCRATISARRCSAARCTRSCAARTARSVRIPTSCRCACRPSACSTSRPKWHVYMRADIGATAVSQHQRPRALAALLRRRRSQRARLRPQRPVAGGAGHRRERRSALRRGRQPGAGKGRRQTPVRRLGRADPRPAAGRISRSRCSATSAMPSTASAIRSCIPSASACACACRWFRWASTSRRR